MVSSQKLGRRSAFGRHGTNPSLRLTHCPLPAARKKSRPLASIRTCGTDPLSCWLPKKRKTHLHTRLGRYLTYLDRNLWDDNKKSRHYIGVVPSTAAAYKRCRRVHIAWTTSPTFAVALVHCNLLQRSMLEYTRLSEPPACSKLLKWRLTAVPCRHLTMHRLTPTLL